MMTWLVAAIAALAIAILVLAFRARAATSRTATGAAADAAVRGEIEHAARLIAKVLASDGRNAEALFVRACIRLQVGNVQGAKEDVDRLQALRGNVLEVRILRELMATRTGAPAEKSAAVFLAALSKIGASGQIQNLLRYVPTTRRALRPESIARVPGDEGFLLRAAEAERPLPPSLITEAQRIAADEQAVPVLLAAAVLLKSGQIGDAKKQEVARAAHDAIAMLARKNPTDLYSQTWAAVTDEPDYSPLTEAEVAKLESIVSSMQIELRLPVMYEAIRNAYAKVDPAQAAEAAFNATFAFYPPPVHVLLMRRTKPMIESHDPSLRRRTGLALARLARKIVDQPSLLDLSIGSMLLARAAALADDSELAAEADRKRKDFRSLLQTADRFKFVAEWPIAPLQRDFIERKVHAEVELLRELR